MRTTDLMIGDYVKYQNHIYIVEEISAKGWVHLIYPETKVRVNMTSDYIIDLLEPIPLTPEILKAKNFWYWEGYYEWWYGPSHGAYSVGGMDDGRIRLGRYEYKYVHEFQHILRLQGKGDIADNFRIE